MTLIEEMGVETLWLHPFEFPPPSASGLGLDAPALDSVLGVTHGLVLIGGSDAVSARRLLHALLAARDAAHPDLTLLVSDDSTYRHAITHGVIVAATPARATALLAALEPQLLVLDPAVDTGLLAAAHAVGIWWVGATGADAAAMACRWVATALGDAEHPRLAALTTLPIVLAYAEGAADDAHDLGCRVARLGETERSLLFAGDVTGLAAALARSDGPPQLRPVRRAS